ncbi:MAG: hypothetical protein AABW54_02925 [Candidatus Micrarchaeota archaeon]
MRVVVRGQVSLEFFLIIALFLVFALWLYNFHGVFAEGVYSSGLAYQQRMVASSVARLAGAACLNGLNLSFQLPCLSRGAPVPFKVLAHNSSRVSVSTLEGDAVGLSACRVEADFVAGCSGGVGEWACFSANNSRVAILRGRCG